MLWRVVAGCECFSGCLVSLLVHLWAPGGKAGISPGGTHLEVCKEQMSLAALHYCCSLGMCLQVSIDGEDKRPLPLPPVFA